MKSEFCRHEGVDLSCQDAATLACSDQGNGRDRHRIVATRILMLVSVVGMEHFPLSGIGAGNGLAAYRFCVVLKRSLRFGFFGGFLKGLLLNACHERLSLAFFVRLRTVQCAFICRFSVGQEL